MDTHEGIYHKGVLSHPWAVRSFCCGPLYFIWIIYIPNEKGWLARKWPHRPPAARRARRRGVPRAELARARRGVGEGGAVLTPHPTLFHTGNQYGTARDVFCGVSDLYYTAVCLY
jgi:hypothetical protein